MSKGTVNKVIIIGNLGADPEKRYTTGEMAITKLRVATTDVRRNRDTNEVTELTEWHRITLFGKTAETAAQYLRKGSKVFIEGRLRTSKYQGPDGQDRWSTEIIGDDMQMLDRVGAGGGSSVPYDDAPRAGPPSGGRPAAAPPAPVDQGGGMPFDDDIPF